MRRLTLGIGSIGVALALFVAPVAFGRGEAPSPALRLAPDSNASAGAAIGSVVYALPESCTAVVVRYVDYEHCGDTWYQPQVSGTTTTYVVVNPPRP